MKSFTPDRICFGLNRQLDMESFSCFLQLAGREEFADLFASRLSSEEIDSFVSHFTDLLKKHLSQDEYHRLFLLEHRHHGHSSEIKE